MSTSVLIEEDGYAVLAIDALGLWWDSIAEARRVLTLADRQVAHGVARYLESVEWAVSVLAVNGPNHFSSLHGVATGELPIEALEIASELVVPYDTQRMMDGGPHPPRLAMLHEAHGLAHLPDDMRDALPAHVRRFAAEGLRQAYDPTTRLAALRAAGELILARATRGTPPTGDPVRMSPDIGRTLLECQRCLCEFWVVPDCREGPGIERYAAPATVSVEWKDVGVDLSRGLDESDECPCHGDDIVLAWGSADARLLAETGDALQRSRAVYRARLGLGPGLVVDVSEGRHLVVRRAEPTGVWEYAIWQGPEIDVAHFSSRDDVPGGRPLRLDGDSPTQASVLAEAVRGVLAGMEA